MAHQIHVSSWIVRALAIGAVVFLNVLHSSAAAVLPVTEDLAASGGSGVRAGLLSAGMLRAMTGHWVGRTDSGKQVSLVLKVQRGSVLGHAYLHGVLPEADRTMRPLVSPTLAGKSVAFTVQATPGAKCTTKGVFTFVSSNSARLDLQSGASPLSVQLVRVS